MRRPQGTASGDGVTWFISFGVDPDDGADVVILSATVAFGSIGEAVRFMRAHPLRLGRPSGRGET